MGKETQYVGASLLMGISLKSISFAFYSVSHGEIKISIDNIDSLDTSINDILDVNVNTKNGLYIGKGFEINENLTLGIATKLQHKSEFILNDEIQDIVSIVKQQKKSNLSKFYKIKKGFCIGFDIGATIKLYKKLNPRFALVIKDIFNTTYFKNKTQPSKELQFINFATDITHHVKNNRYAFSIGTEFLDLLNNSDQRLLKRIHIGFEASYLNKHSLLFGLYQGYPSFGIKTSFNFIAIEFASYTKETAKFIGDSPSPRKSFRIKLGWNL